MKQHHVLRACIFLSYLNICFLLRIYYCFARSYISEKYLENTLEMYL